MSDDPEQLRAQIAMLHEALAIYGSPDNWDFITRDRFTYNDWPELGPTVWGYIEAEKVLSNTAAAAQEHDLAIRQAVLIEVEAHFTADCPGTHNGFAEWLRAALSGKVEEETR